MGKKIEKSGDNDVRIFLGSQLEVSFLEKFETDLIQFLRKELKNDLLTIEKEVVQMEGTRKLYTGKDIYDYMVRENPKLKYFKDKLGLDFD